MKKIVQKNWRVEAYPYSENYHKVDIATQNDIKDDCETLGRQIEKHCVEVGRTKIVCDTRETCEYCGGIWNDFYDEWIDGEDTHCCSDSKADFDASKKCCVCGDKIDFGWSEISRTRCPKCKNWFCVNCFRKSIEDFESEDKYSDWCGSCIKEDIEKQRGEEGPQGRKVRL